MNQPTKDAEWQFDIPGPPVINLKLIGNVYKT